MSEPIRVANCFWSCDFTNYSTGHHPRCPNNTPEPVFDRRIAARREEDKARKIAICFTCYVDQNLETHKAEGHDVREVTL